ncbi:MAG: hypothetical protein AMXMBFR33_14750 [Candidatus Xenobia bacterium]
MFGVIVVSNRSAKILALLLWCLTSQAFGQTIYDRMIFQNQELTPAISQQGPRALVNLQDPMVRRLVDLSSARLHWSTTGQTLFVYAPGRESFWTFNSPTVTVNGQEITAPGRMFGDQVTTMIEPAALIYALCLRAVPSTAGGPTQLLPMLQSVSISKEAYPTVTIRASAPLTYTVEKPEAGLVVLKFSDLIWAGEGRNFSQGSLKAEVIGGSLPGEPLEVRLQLPPAWDGQLKPGTFKNELAITTVPSSQLVGAGPPVGLQRIDYRRVDGDDLVIFYAEDPVRFSWEFDPTSRVLIMEFPGVTMDAPPNPLEAPGAPLSAGRFEQLDADGIPVLRFTGQVAPGYAYEFFEIENARGSLVLRLAPETSLTRLENKGTAATRGYVAAGGRGVVVIDAGHGGGDPGCYSRHHGVYEKDITLDIARRLKTVLERQGWKVLMTRETDRDVTYAGSPDKMELQARCDVANDVGADLFISIHCNASASGQGNGTSIHWYKEEDYEFARNLEPMLGEAIGVGNQGLRRDSFYVLRHTSMPAVLVETAYLSHPHDSSRLVQPQVRQLIAERLAGGLVQFMSGRYARAGNYRQQPMR